ncbi:MAG: cytochrome c biogenesis CcdA family protein [Acidimicrobiales bacterium]
MIDPEATITPVTYAVAFGGGLISFASPCVLPLVPGYLSIVTGLEVGELQESKRSNALAVARDTGLFVLGFGAVFVALGVSATSIGRFVFEQQILLTRLSGALVLGMALFMLGSMYLQAPWLYQEMRFHPQLGRYGRAAPTVAGAAFGFGWTPCIGPVLTSILAIAAASGQASTGAALLAAYTLGLGLPFFITGLLMGRLGASLKWVQDHIQGIVIASSIALALFGVLLIFNQLIRITTMLQDLLRAIGLGSLVELG